MDSLPPWPVALSMLLTVVLPGFAVGAGLLAGVCAATRSETARMIGGALALAGGLALGNFTRGLLPWWSLEPGWPSLFPATLAALGGGARSDNVKKLGQSGGGQCESSRPEDGKPGLPILDSKIREPIC